MRLFVLLFVLLSANSAYSQGKFFSSPGRGADGAKQNAQVITLQGENERMNACTAAGRIYAPTHPNKDANDCIPHLTLNPTTGTATFANGLATAAGDTSLTGDLSVSGVSFFGSNVDVSGRMTANQVYVGSGNIGNIPTCTSAEKLQWSGTEWTCVTDSIGATAATEVDPKVGTLTNGRWCRTSGTQVICDVNVPLNCGTSQKLHWNGIGWTCIADQGITAETDPKVGTLTNGKWCTASGGQVVCTSDAPSGSTTTTTGGGADCGSGSGAWQCGGCGSGSHLQVKSCSCDCGTVTCQCSNGSWIFAGGSCPGCDDNGDW